MSDTKPAEKPDLLDVVDGKGRKISLKVMGPADMLNLLEAAGANSSNAAWMRMAMTIASVRAIDGIPVPAAYKKKDVLDAANKLGNEGLAAAAKALFGDPAAETDGDADGAAPSAEQEQAEGLETAKN